MKKSVLLLTLGIISIAAPCNLLANHKSLQEMDSNTLMKEAVTAIAVNPYFGSTAASQDFKIDESLIALTVMNESNNPVFASKMMEARSLNGILRSLYQGLPPAWSEGGAE